MYPPQDFVAHLSGWVRLKLGAVTWMFFAAELGTWASGQEGPKLEKMKVLRMKFSIVEHVPTPWGSIFELGRASQGPYRAIIPQI